MSTKAVIVWLVLALILGIVVIYLLLHPPGASSNTSSVPVGSRLMEFSPGDVTRIIVQQSGSETKEIIEQAPGGKSILGADADWQLRIESPKSATAPPPWPIESAKMQSLLRLLSEARAVAIPPADSSLGQPTRVEIFIKDSPWTWLLSERTIAGTGLIQIEPHDNQPAKRALVDQQLLAVFTNPGPTIWRERFVVGGIAPDASRITLDAGQQRILLAKSEGRWTMREPVAAPADPVAVQRLIAELGKIQIADFLDSPSASATTGLEKPVATLKIEADRRTMLPGAAEPKVTTDTLTLTIGGAADTSITRLFGSVNGTYNVLIEARSFAGQAIKMDPGAYIWPHPFRLSSSDVGGIALKQSNPQPTSTASKTFKRAVSKWLQVLSESATSALPPKDAREVEGLLTFLTGGEKSQNPGNPASPGASRPVITTTQPADFRLVGSIELSSLSGDPLGMVQLALSGEGTCVIHSGSVFLAYPIPQLPPLLVDLVSSTAPQTPKTAPDPEPNK